MNGSGHMTSGELSSGADIEYQRIRLRAKGCGEVWDNFEGSCADFACLCALHRDKQRAEAQRMAGCPRAQSDGADENGAPNHCMSNPCVIASPDNLKPKLFIPQNQSGCGE